MAITPLPDLSVPQNVGFSETDTEPIIHSIRWRHSPSRYIFTDVQDVITFHERGLKEIDIQVHSVSYLDIYCRKDVKITEIKAYLRFVTENGSSLVEEPYTVGEGGKSISLADDPNNPNLKIIKGFAFTQKDLGDGTPMYDFISMTKEGIYEIWLKCVTDSAKELHVRIPFVWANLYGSDPSDGGGSGEDTPVKPPRVEGKLHAQYDEYYVTIIEGDSPFTKRPSTHFRMAGVGMLHTPYCYERIDTPPQQSIENPANDPIVGDKPTEPCGLTVSPSQFLEIEVGKTGKFKLIHKNDSGILKIEVVTDKTAVEELGDGEFKVVRIGTHDIKFIVTYNDGQQCTVSAKIIGKAESPPPDPGTGGGDNGGSDGGSDGGTDTGDGGGTTPDPDPNPNEPAPSAYCGEMIKGDSGHNSRTFKVTETGTYYIEYNFFSEPDEMFIYVNGVLKHRTGSQVYSSGSPLAFKYKPSDGTLKINMNRTNEGTRWTYTLYCPSSVPDEIKANAPVVF
ncbi:hypothetical protein [Bacillus haynesii]|uniref:hypothetical protein n=1 Tax=Bacillus haynesii TaxID=1925021 RepID=UPI00227DD2B0|nr:hypothetical protein [Bacillus haynesii]MCY8291520.1 hypothetical protein [Bacillus haynesii]